MVDEGENHRNEYTAVMDEEAIEERGGSPVPQKAASNIFWITSMIISYAFTSLAVSVINPFFPIYMIERGLNNTVAGLIIATVWLPQLLFFPVLCDFVIQSGVKTIFVMGNFIFAVTTILFAFTDFIMHAGVFIGLCFAIKFVQGIGLAFIKTAAVCIVSRFIPENSATILGMLETGSAFGFIIGPILGGVLFDCLDFKLSVLVPGIILLGVFLLSIASMHRGLVFNEADTAITGDSQDGIKTQQSQLIRLVDTYILAFCCFFSFFIPSFYDIMFPMYGSEQAFLKPSSIGGILLIFALPDCISTLVSGKFMERIGNGRRLLFSGTLINALGFFAIAAFGLFNLLNYYTLATLITLQAAVTSLMLIPVFKVIKEVAYENGLILDNDMNVAISNIIVTAAMTGQFTGNGSSGILYDTLGVTLSAFLFFILFCLLMTLQLRFIRPQNEPTETTMLLQQ